jgi:hypothetical protein
VRNFGRLPEPRRDKAACADFTDAGPAVGIPSVAGSGSFAAGGGRRTSDAQDQHRRRQQDDD